MRAGVALAVAVWLFGAGAEVFAQGQLANVRADVQGSSSSSSNDKKQSNKNGSDLLEDNDDSTSLFFAGFFHDPTEWRWFPAYPYVDGLSSYMQMDPGPEGTINGHTREELDLKPWSLRLSVENGNNFDGLNRFTGTALVETCRGLGLYTSWDYLYENLGHGYYDDLVLGNITVTWRFLESRRLLMRWGIGAWIVTEPCGCFTDTGLNLHLSADYFPVRPFVLSGLIEGGSLGATGILHSRESIGVLWRGLEFYVGYDFMQIGSSNIHTPMLGARLWF